MSLAYCFSGNYSKALGRPGGGAARGRLTLKTATGFILSRVVYRWSSGTETRTHRRRRRRHRVRAGMELCTRRRMNVKERGLMKRLMTTLAGLGVLFACATGAAAQVRRVEMRIDGYLCGN